MQQLRGIRPLHETAQLWTQSASIGVLALALTACDRTVEIDHPSINNTANIAENDPVSAIFELSPTQTALLIVDPQNDFLSSQGALWGLVGKAVVENNVIPNLASLLTTASRVDMPVFVAPHHFHPAGEAPQATSNPSETGSATQFDGTHLPEFDDADAFRSRWHEDLDAPLTTSSPRILAEHAFNEPATDNLVTSLRNTGISTVILAGMPADLCLNDHLRVLIANGFDVMVVTDATAGLVTRDYDGDLIAHDYFTANASATATTETTIAKIQSAYEEPPTLRPP